MPTIENTGLLAAMMASTMSSKEKQDVYEISKLPSVDLKDLIKYDSYGQKPYKKKPLSNKQKKGREANKRAKKSRSRNN